MDFAITEGPVDARTHLVEPHGEIDRTTAPELKQSLLEAVDSGAEWLIVDLAEVRFIDSTGLKLLLSMQARLDARGGKMLIVCPDPVLRRLFEVSGVVEQLGVVGSRREALRLTDSASARTPA